MKTIVDKAERLWRMAQPGLGSLKSVRRRLESRGAEMIDLCSHIPEIPAYEPFRKKLAALDPVRMAASADGELISKLKESIVQNHLSLSSAALDPENEIIITPGIKLSAAFLAMAFLNPGDTAAYPDPGTQYFRTAICLAEGRPWPYSLNEGNDYVANLSSLTLPLPEKLKLIFLNYPHNPTGASVDYFFYRDLIKSISFENVLIAADCGHIHPGDPDISGLLQVKGARKKGLELHSFATTFGLNGLGFAVGHRDVIAILKSLLDTVGFVPDVGKILWAIAGLENAEGLFSSRMDILKNRRDILADGLKELGWRLRAGKLVPFLWVKAPVWSSSLAFARRLAIKAGVKVVSGSDFGESGEGWVRIGLYHDEPTLREALERISHHSKIWQRKFKPKG